jgi:hypothetical protein
LKSKKQENHGSSSNQKLIKGGSQEIAEMMVENKLLESGGHNLLIYNDLKTLREIYSQYSKALLPKNEIVIIGTQYDPIDEVKNALRLSGDDDDDDDDGLDVERYLNQGTLFIADAQQGYQRDADHRGMWKLAMSLISRAKKEGRLGVTWFGDLGSFFSFEKIEDMIEYELWLPQKNEEDMMKGVCCYHSKDFEKLNETQQQRLFDHHFKSILIE